MPIWHGGGGGGGNVSFPISIAHGGTGQTTAAAALAALGGVGSGSHTLKKGAGGGTFYQTTSTSFAAIDAANLDITVTVPTGSLAIALMVGAESWFGSSGLGYLAEFIDGAQNCTQVTGNGNVGIWIGFSTLAFLAGDGASHTFSPKFKSGDGAGTQFVADYDTFVTVQHSVIIIPAT